MRKTIYTEIDTLFSARHVRQLELNFIAFRDMVTYVEDQLHRHNFVDNEAHQSHQIKHTFANGSTRSVKDSINWLDARMRAFLVPTLANDQQEIIDARASMDGKVSKTLGARLGRDFNSLRNDLDKELNIAADSSYLWTPPYIKGAMRGENEAPLHNEPTENLKVFYDKFVDNEYCRKTYIGKDQSGQYSVYSYTFEPQHYSKTLLLTSCIHGNEYSAFYANSRFLDLVVNKWHTDPHLAYIRKNVRIVCVPIVNPHGFANDNRENVNNVDLNRNFDYNWKAGKGTNPTGKNFKGKAPFSEQESKNMKKLVEGLNHITAHVDCHNIVSQVSDYCLFYPRFSNQDHNLMTQFMQDVSNHGDLVTWGSSTLSSFSNWVGIKKNITSYLPEIYEGRAGKPRGAEEMWRSVNFLGNIIIRLMQTNNSGQGRTSNESFAKSFVYSDRYNNKGVPTFSLIATNKWQRMLMTQQRFNITANGIVEMNGSITVEVDRDTTFGVSPMVVQNYNPWSGNDKSDERQLFKTEHKLPKGIHTIPINAIAPVQMSSITPSDVHRTAEVMCPVEVRRSEGVCHIKQLIQNIKFIPTGSHNAFQAFTSTGYGNQKEKTFKQIYPNYESAYDIRNEIITKK